jgi:hypothetical protein
MGWLLDTNILSELRKPKGPAYVLPANSSDY